jgi:hypothetical protein
MNAILFWVAPGFRLTGSTINAIEYFLAGFEHNPELRLFLVNGNRFFRDEIVSIMNERYDFINMQNAINNIEFIRVHSLPTQYFDTILILDYMTIFKVRGIINAKKILVISEKFTENPKYFLNKSLYNVTYYGEMGFHYKDIDYRMKCLFDKYKPLRNVQIGTYINSPNNRDLEKIQEDFPDLPKPIYFKSKTMAEENLFEKFTHYLYYHADAWFDPHPRLFLECCFYNKTIIYHNPIDLRDGSWYRYRDIIENGIEGRTLNKEDEIISQLI